MRTILLAVTTIIILSSAGISLRAQDDLPTFPSTSLGKPALTNQPVWQGRLDAAYVGGTRARFMGNNLNDSDAFNFNIEIGTRLALTEDWFLNLGLVSANTFFGGTTPFAPVPDEIHTLSFNTGLGYRINEQWTITGLFSPELYRFDDVGSDDVGFSGGALATYRMSPKLMFSFGVIVAPDSDVKALPIGGVRWLIDQNWTLEAGLPRTRLTYKLDEKWSVYGGVDYNGTTFRAANDQGNKIGMPAYNNALGTYRDIRVGVGVGYEMVRGIRAEIETGGSVYRRVNYPRVDDHVDFQPAPYVRAGLNVRF